MMKKTKIALTVAAGALAAVTLVGQSAPQSALPAGHVAAHVLGKVRFDANRIGQLMGFFTFIDGFGTDIFAAGPKNERTAQFVYRTTPFKLDVAAFGTILHARPTPATGDAIRYEIFYAPSPTNRSFDRPESFSEGELVAIYRSGVIQLEAVPLLMAVANGTLSLEFSKDFDFRGRRVSFANIEALTVQLRGGPSPSARSTEPVLTFDYGGTGVVEKKAEPVR